MCTPPHKKHLFMAKKFIGLLAGMAVIGGAATLFAQEGAKPAKAAEGTLMIDGKNYPLTHALAYETTINEEELIAVVLSGQPISSEELKKAKEGEKEGQDSEFKRPFIKLEFTKAGELKLWSASAGNTQLGRRGGNTTGERPSHDRLPSWSRGCTAVQEHIPGRRARSCLAGALGRPA